MFDLTVLEPVDYLVIGHVTVDQTPNGPRLGGTAAYSGLTAKSLGLRVGIVTARGTDAPLGALENIPVAGFTAEESTSFENQYTPEGRTQYLRGLAPNLEYYHVPEAWRSAAIVHLGPVAQEVDPGMVRMFPSGLIGVTPQGWLREWNSSGRVNACEWPEATFVLGRAGACVISIEDVESDEDRIDELATSTRVLAVTEAAQGSRLYWNGDVRRFRAPQVDEVDATGAGDVFAAAFFYRLSHTRDPWEAARFATQLSAISVTRPGLDGIPTPEEIEASLVEVFYPRMSRIYTIANQKGGVGKTTTAINLGAYLAYYGQRVLLVDLDPQANATSCLKIDKHVVKGGTYDVLIGSAGAGGLIMHNPRLKLSLLPASPALAGAEVELVNEMAREGRLKRGLEPIAERYDYVLIDCPPSLGLLTLNGLVAARDGILIPVQCEYLALEGLGQLTNTLDRVRKAVFPELDVRGVVLTMYDGRTNLGNDVVQEVRRYFGDKVFKTIVPRSIRLAEAPSFGQPISVYAPASGGAHAYASLAQELLSGDGIQVPEPSAPPGVSSPKIGDPRLSEPKAGLP